MPDSWLIWLGLLVGFTLALLCALAGVPADRHLPRSRSRAGRAAAPDARAETDETLVRAGNASRSATAGSRLGADQRWPLAGADCGA